jgi:predicted ATPase
MDHIRTPDQRLRVFISSTMNELVDERRAAGRAVERLHLTPVMFELGARPYPPRDLYLAYLRQSDVFVGIYGSQYGWIAPGQEHSGLEDEYLAAGDKPRLVYVRSPAPDRDPRLVELLKRVRQSGVSYHTYRTARDLGRLISDDLALLESERFAAVSQPTVEPTVAADPSTPAPAVGEIGRDRPGAANRFIGRRSELAAVNGLVTDHETRLLTLTGPGGIGKSRLAIQTAATAAGNFESIAVAELDQVSSAQPVVASAIASALGIPEPTSASLLDSVVGYIGSRRILLVLDGFERQLDSAPFVAQMIAETRQLAVLVTSRERLHLTGERVFEVPPLAVADWSDGVAAVRESDSVQLFIDRAAAAGANLRLEDSKIRTIAEICQRLDGLPLAIELAGSRMRMFDVDELNRILNRSLAILTGGPRDLPERQQTLRSTIAWSYDLLDDRDRCLFARLAVFPGSFSLQAAEAICVDERVPDALDGVSSLVDKALLRPDHSLPGQPRFNMLEVVREFADDQLKTEGDRDRLRRLHASYYRQRAVGGARRLRIGDMRRAIEEYVADQANVRAALQWFIDSRDGGAAAEIGLAAWPLWFTLGRYTEGRDAMERTLEPGVELTEDSRADAMMSMGMMVFEAGEYERAYRILQPALDRYLNRGDARGIAMASVPLGVITGLDDASRGDGQRMLHRAVDGMRRLDDRWGLAFALLALGATLLVNRREVDAIAPLEEGADIARVGGEDTLLSNALVGVGQAHLARQHMDAARTALGESLQLAVGLANRETIARSLDALAALVEQVGDVSEGAILQGAADGIRGSLGADVWHIDRRSHAETVERLRSRLGTETYARLAGEGAELGTDDALNVARTAAARRTT